eukprot:2930598-Pyramimonas_sp.AAC.1
MATTWTTSATMCTPRRWRLRRKRIKMAATRMSTSFMNPALALRSEADVQASPPLAPLAWSPGERCRAAARQGSSCGGLWMFSEVVGA